MRSTISARSSKTRVRWKEISARKCRSTSSATSKWVLTADCGTAADFPLAASAPTPTPAPARDRARALWPIRRKRRRRLNGESTGEGHQEEGLQEERKAHCARRRGSHPGDVQQHHRHHLRSGGPDGIVVERGLSRIPRLP